MDSAPASDAGSICSFNVNEATVYYMLEPGGKLIARDTNYRPGPDDIDPLIDPALPDVPILRITRNYQLALLFWKWYRDYSPYRTSYQSDILFGTVRFLAQQGHRLDEYPSVIDQLEEAMRHIHENKLLDPATPITMKILENGIKEWRSRTIGKMRKKGKKATVRYVAHGFSKWLFAS